MRKIAILTITILLACRLDAQIMKLQYEKDGVIYPVVIDNSAMSTKTKKTAEELQQHRVSGENWAMKPHQECDEINRKVSPLFAISPKGVGTKTWEDAQNACAQYQGLSGNESEKGKWRLPTQREMIWIFILGAMDNDLVTTGYTPFVDNSYYWCVTEYSGGINRAWYLQTHYGSSENGKPTTSLNHFRCIRDL